MKLQTNQGRNQTDDKSSTHDSTYNLVHNQIVLDSMCISLMCVAMVSVYLLPSSWPPLLEATLQDNIQRVIHAVALFKLLIWIRMNKNNARNYLKRRNMFFFAVKVIYFILPVLRRGTVMRSRLDVVPSTSSFRSKFIQQPSMFLVGSHLLLLLIAGIMMQLPLSMQLPIQMFAVKSATNLTSLCSTKMLQTEQCQSYFAAAAAIIQLLPQSLASPSVGIVPILAPTEPLQQCIAVVFYLQLLVGVILPILLLVTLAPPIVVLAVKPSEHSIDTFVLRVISKFVTPNAKLLPFITQEGEEVVHGGWEDEEFAGRRFIWQLVRPFLWWFLLSLMWLYCCYVAYNSP